MRGVSFLVSTALLGALYVGCQCSGGDGGSAIDGGHDSALLRDVTSDVPGYLDAETCVPSDRLGALLPVAAGSFLVGSRSLALPGPPPRAILRDPGHQRSPDAARRSYGGSRMCHPRMQRELLQPRPSDDVSLLLSGRSRGRLHGEDGRRGRRSGWHLHGRDEEPSERFGRYRLWRNNGVDGRTTDVRPR